MNYLSAVFLLSAVAAAVLCGCCRRSKVSLPGKDFILIDVRTPSEFAEGHLRGAVNIPHDVIAEKIQTVAPDKNTALYLYCRSGRRVEAARESLKKLDYKKTYNLGGLTQAAETLKLPVEK